MSDLVVQTLGSTHRMIRETAHLLPAIACMATIQPFHLAGSDKARRRKGARWTCDACPGKSTIPG